MNIILFGPTGAGKGTMGDMLVEEFKFKKLSTGELFRIEMENKTELGLKIFDIMQTPHLVDDETTFSVVEKHLKEDNNIFDGFPKTLHQAKWLSDKTNIDVMAELKMEDEAIVRRLSSRRVCSKCQWIFNLVTPELKPKQEGICDKCGGKLVQRPKDKPEIIRERLKIYHESTKPVIEFFKEKGVRYEEVNADQPPLEEYAELKNKLKIEKD